VQAGKEIVLGEEEGRTNSRREHVEIYFKCET